MKNASYRDTKLVTTTPSTMSVINFCDENVLYDLLIYHTFQIYLIRHAATQLNCTILRKFLKMLFRIAPEVCARRLCIAAISYDISITTSNISKS